MSYLVLARKWRPQSFEDLTGQEHVVRTLANAIAQDRVAHAFLLCGPRGVGKTTTARLLARALNCAKGPTAEPCGECLPCKEIVQGSSVDVAEIDGASNNGVDNVRELREAARYMPQRDRHKIYVIDEVHMLSVAAFNALLKTLEEPPPHVKFIFATTDPQKLPETILSRCQRHNFRRIPLEQMVGRLRRICSGEKVTISDRALGLVCKQADGGMRDAVSLLDQLLSSVGTELPDRAVEEALGLVDTTAVLSLARSLIERDGKGLLAQVGELHERGVELKKLCEELAQLLRDLIVTRATGEAPQDRADAERQALSELAASSDPVQLTRLFDLVHGAIRDVGYASQPRLALEVALLTGVHLAPAQGLAQLAARLEAVTASLGGVGPAPSPGGAGRGGSTPERPAVTPARGAAPAERAASPAGQKRSPPDLVSQVQQLVKGRPAGREAPSRSAAPRTSTTDDDEPPPPGDDDAPPELEPARLLPREALPGGCATGECSTPPAKPAPEPRLQEKLAPESKPQAGPAPEAKPQARPAPKPEVAQAPQPPAAPFTFTPPPPQPRPARNGPAPAAPQAPLDATDDPTRDPGERWSAAVEAIRARDPMLAILLAEARLLWLRPGEVALGFSPEQRFHRSQLEGNARAQVEALLASFFGRTTKISTQDAAADAPTSIAEQKRRAREERAKAIRVEARESDAVRLVQTVLGGEIDEIEILEER